MKENDLTLERYKYILDQKRWLNQVSFRLTSMFQLIAIAIFVGQYKVILDHSNGMVSKDIAVSASMVLLLVSVMVSVFGIGMVVSGMFSWFQYKKEEVNIEILSGDLQSELPKFWNFVRWYESYIIVMMFAFPFCYFFILKSYFLPLFNG
ncbi:hypothetical protein [Thalassospira xiamenensis]|uniref:hypothetical protein n=1 Tax=Thalassospira xiamenensis TaxID=220697 RepID=UPI003AA8F109